MNKSVAAAILAGGQNRRMGRNKALVEIGGQAMLARIIARLSPLFEHVMIAGNDIPAYEPFGLPVHRDLRPDHGSLGGIFTALAASPLPKVFCTGCDMPFISPGIVTELLRLAGGEHDAVIPGIGNKLEPVCAVYSTSLLPLIARHLDSGTRKIKDALAEANLLVVDAETLRPHDPDLLTFFNVNSPEDLERARALALSGR